MTLLFCFLTELLIITSFYEQFMTHCHRNTSIFPVWRRGLNETICITTLYRTRCCLQLLQLCVLCLLALCFLLSSIIQTLARSFQGLLVFQWSFSRSRTGRLIESLLTSSHTPTQATAFKHAPFKTYQQFWQPILILIQNDIAKT